MPSLDLTPARSAALYVRRSRKGVAGATENNGRSLAEQTEETHALAERLGLDVVTVYTEAEGTGASNRSRKKRPEWERALADLGRGDRFHTLVFWALDRADRRGAAQVAALLDRWADGSRRLVGVDGTDTADPTRRLEIIIRSEIARDESERIASRVTRTKRSRRREGRWLGGKAPFGLRIGDGSRLEHDPATYPIARRIAEEFLAGRPAHTIAKTLSTEGVPTPSGLATWRSGWISRLVRSPGFAGLQSQPRRTASGGFADIAEVYVTEDGETVRVGDGVITPRERATILRTMGRTEETSSTRGAGAARGTFTGGPLRGLVWCAECGTRATTSVRSGKKGQRYRYWVCPNPGNAPGKCGGFTANYEGVEEYVVGRFLSALATLDPDDGVLATVADRWVGVVEPEKAHATESLHDALDEAHAALTRLQSMTEIGVLTPEEALPRVRTARARIAEIETKIAAASAGPIDVSPLLDVVQSREAWDALTVAERRDLLTIGLDAVRVRRGGVRGQPFDGRERAILEGPLFAR